MGTYVALLRGINVGGKNALPMKELAGMFEEAGCSDVRTYVQSGNVVFGAPATLAGRVPERVSARISATYAYEVPIVVRTAAELRAVLEGNPFLAESPEPKALHVMFLREAPTRAAVRSLDPDRSPPDRFALKGKEVYLHCPHGLGKSKLTNAYFDGRLGTVGTVRNWNTVGALVALADASR